jgi:tRNA(Ile)-lysidine synthase
MFVAETGSSWAAALSQGTRWRVRAWRPGDRVQAHGQTTARRVKRYFNEHGIPVLDRRRWPVVVEGDRVLWVPGICQAQAALDGGKRSLTYMVCERFAG